VFGHLKDQNSRDAFAEFVEICGSKTMYGEPGCTNMKIASCWADTAGIPIEWPHNEVDDGSMW